ncbi:MAG: hypothetical protein ACYDHX_06355 [Methanothrix sp.]
MVFFIILLSLVSVACGELKISVSTGDTSGSSGYTESLGAKINDQIYESTTLAGSTLSQSFKGNGDKAETFSVTNNAGDHAEVGFDIENSKSYSGSYTLSPKTVKYAQATEKLDVNAADSIYAFAYASTRDRYENAFLSLSITKGSLVGYSNSAYATLGKATVTQKMKSASVESIWVNEKAGKGLNYNDLDYFVGDELYSPNSNNGLLSGIQNSKLTDYSESATATNNLAQTNGVILTTYSGSATATNKMAEKKRTIGSFSAPANIMYWSSYAYNRNGDRSNSLIEISNGQLSKYTMTAKATPTYVGSVVMAGSAKGDNIDTSGHSYNSEGDNSKVLITDSGVASINNLYLSPYADLKSVESYGHFDTISGLSIKGTGTAFNAEGDSSQTSISVTNGYINSWYSDNQAKKGSATNPYMYFSQAAGTLVDVKSHAENRRPAYEGFPDDPVNYGGGDFEVQAKSLAKTRLQSAATSSNVLITPTLPKTIKTAVILEPVQKFTVEEAGATDLGSTVFPDLVGKGYATLRYTDSGASRDKYSNLGLYDVVLAVGHMDSNNIYLSTAPRGADYISANQLKYKTSKKSLVIFNGCDSFDGYPQKSALATAVARAYLSGGYAGEVGMAWSLDYLSYFFDELTLKDGKTAGVANANALAEVTNKYGSGQYYLPLQFYGKDDFKL